MSVQVPRIRDRENQKDGIHLHAQMENSAECVLVIVGVTDQGNKEILAIEGGHCESKKSWLTLLRNLKERGLKAATQTSCW